MKVYEVYNKVSSVLFATKESAIKFVEKYFTTPTVYPEMVEREVIGNNNVYNVEGDYDCHPLMFIPEKDFYIDVVTGEKYAD